jgi:hypothetical protein
MAAMPRPRLLSFALVAAAAIAACTATTPPSPPPPSLPPAEGTWRHVMRQLEAHGKTLEHELVAKPAPDLRAVVDAATAAAALVRGGYGKFEDRAVPGFAAFARDAESWFLVIALEARQAHEELARDAWKGAKERHCGACHDAHHKVHG